MLSYLIDAFNLFHKIPALKSATLPHSELIQYIIRGKFTGSPNNKVTIVFDGYEGDHVSGGGYKILYSGGRKADDIIKEIIARSSKNRQLVVVSDDNEIISSARLEGVSIQSTKEFLKIGSPKPAGRDSSDDRGLDSATMDNITKELEKEWGVK